ncbi:MAG: T9SS type A sorting domain-containing protein [Bacteroidetes bacterium]|nr:T9SS type A sorting domain-containing protein [Bacteroidota bacterium]
MKKPFLIFFLFVIASAAKQSQAQTNVYHPIPDTNAIWNEETWWIVWSTPPCVVHDNYTLFFNGDTIVGTYTYKKIYASGFIGAPPCQPPGYNYYNQYKGALRQDSTLKQVFFLGNPSEYLIYDFNMNIGDTISYNGIQNEVIGIDSTMVGNNYHKRFLLKSITSPPSPQDSTYAIIEGVGSTFGLYNPIIPPFESGSQLYFFCHNGFEAYPSTNTVCSFNVGISETNKQENKISILPNPFSTSTTLHSDNYLTNATLTVYNCFGQAVKSLVISHSPFVIERGNLASGLYFIRLMQDNKTIATEKLIITDN